jgi:zinc/manganese transport system permease protein
MIANLLDLLAEPFMQRALVGGLLLGIVGGLLGSFVILRGLSLFGDTLGHAGILGVVIAALFQWSPTPTLIMFAILFGVVVRWLSERTHLGEDTILGVALASSVSLGLIGFTFIQGFRGNLTAILFGDILAIGYLDLYLLFVVLLFILIVLYFTLPQQILVSLNLDLAKVNKIPVQLYQYGFVILLAVVIALSIRSVGILLVNGFLVIPAATSRLVCHRFVPFLVTSSCLGMASAVGGILLSGLFNLPSGPAMVLVQLVFFLGAVVGPVSYTHLTLPTKA